MNSFVAESLKRSSESTRPRWSLDETAGRLVEISESGAASALAFAFSLVVEAQQQGEPVGWVASRDSFFSPPDAAERERAPSPLLLAEEWAAAISMEIGALGFCADVVVGFTRFGTYAVAKKAKGTVVFRNPSEERAAARAVPLDCLNLDRDFRAALLKLGIKNAGCAHAGLGPSDGSGSPSLGDSGVFCRGDRDRADR
jgi:hypothetical protein